MSTGYLVVTMDDDHNGHPAYCADKEGVRAVVRACMVMPGELTDEQDEEITGVVDTLLDSGAMHFEGDPSIYLFRLSDLRGPTYPQAWLPIATAPRDGTTILLRFGQDGVSQGRYDHVPNNPGHPWQFIDSQGEGRWIINRAVDALGGPSHWMPMPGDKV